MEGFDRKKLLKYYKLMEEKIHYLEDQLDFYEAQKAYILERLEEGEI